MPFFKTTSVLTLINSGGKVTTTRKCVVSKTKEDALSDNRCIMKDVTNKLKNNRGFRFEMERATNVHVNESCVRAEMAWCADGQEGHWTLTCEEMAGFSYHDLDTMLRAAE
jgi:hypothetical protein